MAERRMITVDGNEAAASVAHRMNEVIAIYPITPSSPMGEHSDAWSSVNRPNIWGTVPDVIEMQSEGGAAGAVHGSLQAGALTTTFTASQGLLLMIPNMYKIAGELNSHVMHVTARTLATHALSIFGDHSDVMACRQIGFGMLASNSVQEAHDFAAIAQTATLKSRIPFIHFFDGFRTSHEVSKMEELTNEDLLGMIDNEDIKALRERSLTPDHPVLRGTAQNPDTFFQQRERANTYYDVCPEIVQDAMDRFANIAGRKYNLFDYVGHPEAEQIIILMGSGAEAAHETVDYLVAAGQKVGMIKVRLYRPFSIKHFMNAIPATVKTITVLDRTKESGTVGEPLYLDVIAAIVETGRTFKVLGGRYGLSSKEFTPACIKAVFENAVSAQAKNHFTVGIVDDVTNTSIPVDESFDIESNKVVRAVFFGLGADGTVGANKNSIKIIGGETPNYAQGYFVYDSKKSGAGTISHLRFGPEPIRSTYLIKSASFVACHVFEFVYRIDMLKYAAPKAVFLLNAPYPKDEVWQHLPKEVQEQIIKKDLQFYVIDAYSVARDTGMGYRTNTIMQTCFFAISGVLPQDEAIERIKYSIKKTYSSKGEEIVKKNYIAVDESLAHLHKIEYPQIVADCSVCRPSLVSPEAPEFVQSVIGEIMAGRGDDLPVSAFSPDGTWPTATTQWEKRNVALDIPLWEPDVCIQCNKCSLVCPHAAIRAKIVRPEDLEGAPETFRTAPAKGKEYKGLRFVIQSAVEDCTGCGICISACPAKNKAEPGKKAINMAPQLPLRERERTNYAFFLKLPDMDRASIKNIDVKHSQFMQPLFEYSGACAGCGETPYVKLVSQLFGDRAIISNATGCSSIYGGNLPTTPYTVNPNGRGPAWSNSLFEDNAEFGFGFRLAIDSNKKIARELVAHLASLLGEDLVNDTLKADMSSEAGIAEQRKRVEIIKAKIANVGTPEAIRLYDVADYLVEKSVWMIGGDGWAFDIGYGGLDHVIANKRNVNILVLNTEVYSNTGGQASKATPVGASAKFAAAGKEIEKKDLGLMAMNYGSVYVAQVAIGAKDIQTVKAFREAESFDGPSLIIAYSHCIAHGFELENGLEQQKLAVASGLCQLYRYDPRRTAQGLAPLQLDSDAPTIDVLDYMKNEARYRMVQKANPVRFAALVEQARQGVAKKRALYEHLASLVYPNK